MSGLLILGIWSTSGVLASAALSSADRSRWAWTPLAAVFGPLWLSVAADQRALARRSLRVPTHQLSDDVTIWLRDLDPDDATDHRRTGATR